jgi:hypothetical protein
MPNRYLRRYKLPGPMDGYSGSLQTDKRPPGSNHMKRGLNPSPLGTRSGANFGKIDLYRDLPIPNQTLGFRGYGLGFASGKWAPGPCAGQWEISFYAGRELRRRRETKRGWHGPSGY